MPSDFAKEVKERVEAVLPKVDSSATFKGCTDHTFMKDTVVVALSKNGRDITMPVDRETWEMTGCKTNDSAVENFLKEILGGV